MKSEKMRNQGATSAEDPSTWPVALVTGCSSGIGKATAAHLAERGWHVFATSRSAVPFDGSNESIRSSSGRGVITSLPLEVTDESSCAAAVERALSVTGRIDALVNNAGYSEVGALEMATPEEVRRQFETCAFAPLRLAQLVLPSMRSRGQGRIVNISTIGGRVAIPFLGLYNGAKFALEAMSDALRMEVYPFGIDVIIIEPGGVTTNFANVARKQSTRFSGDSGSPYQRYFEGFNAFIESAITRSASPEVVAVVIHRALTARRPRTRYPATLDARLMLTLLPHLSDRVKDALWRRMTGLR